ncbi:MAG: pilus assembly protein N-terminal domain-containing protein [Rhodobacteraceae bacterium]|nr:pilus assembly protein N-terminal domain-containing protein [Paracoccaceae bacterium]
MSKQFITSVSRAITVGFAGLCFSALLPQTAFAGDFSATEDFSVALNKTQIMRLPAPAAAIIVGNPAIADVSVHSPTLLFVLGRGYGVTNVIILDNMGNTIMDTNIQVGNIQSGSDHR